MAKFFKSMQRQTTRMTTEAELLSLCNSKNEYSMSDIGCWVSDQSWEKRYYSSDIDVYLRIPLSLYCPTHGLIMCSTGF